MFFPVSSWAAAFLLTLSVEIPVAAYLLRSVEPSLPRRVVLVVLANLVTHPVVWYVISQLLLIGTSAYVLAAETWAVGAEAVFYGVVVRGIPARRAIGVSVIANAMSFFVGRVVGATLPELFR